MLSGLLLWILVVVYSADGGDWARVFERQSVNVRTVLFRPMDLSKVCWSQEELSLLFARRLMQDLIPRKAPKDFPLLLKYLRDSLDVVRSKTPNTSSKVMSMAINDVFGGYLKAIVLPILNEAYYAGNVDYDTTSAFHTLYGQIMVELGTNGRTWSQPCDMSQIPTKVAPLSITACKHEEACRSLLGTSEENSCTKSDMFSSSNTNLGDVKVKLPMPFLDDNKYPCAIAVPFREHSLFSLMAKGSANLLLKYYILSIRCLMGPNTTHQELVTFNHILHHWIISTVGPHLHDEGRWFPGFGGVMRIVETMNQNGMVAAERFKPETYPSNYPFSNLDLDDSCFDEFFSFDNWVFLLLLGLLLLVIILLCLLIYCCIRRHKAKQNECLSILDEDGDGMVKTLMSIYCGVKDSMKNPASTSTVCSKGSHRSEVQQRVKPYRTSLQWEKDD